MGIILGSNGLFALADALKKVQESTENVSSTTSSVSGNVTALISISENTTSLKSVTIIDSSMSSNIMDVQNILGFLLDRAWVTWIFVGFMVLFAVLCLVEHFRAIFFLRKLAGQDSEKAITLAEK